MGQFMNIDQFQKTIREIIRTELAYHTMTEDEYDRARDAWLDQNDGDWNAFRRKGGDLSPYYPTTSTSYKRSGRKPASPRASAQSPAPAADKSAMLQQMVKYKNTDGTDGEATVKSLLSYPKDHPGRKAAARVYAKTMAKLGQSRPKSEGTEICEGEGCGESTNTMGTNTNANNKLRQIVREELKNIVRELIAQSKEETPSVSLQNPAPSDDTKELEEKSVPQPYDRTKARKMSKGQIEKRDAIGKRMEKNRKIVAKFRKQHGQDWKSYLWAAASAAAFREK